MMIIIHDVMMTMMTTSDEDHLDQRDDDLEDIGCPINKAIYTATPVAGGWAGAVMSWEGAVMS